MIKEHLNQFWSNHLAAGTGTIFSLVMGNSLLRSIISGVAIYLITNLLRVLYKKIKDYICNLKKLV